ncbi:MAG TPA: flagellar biosynthesis protein FlhB [Gammaproteobacteria bacterium]|nr:flagellar biosynthesis protein FlhB [Gammaproteobacteria bacterium]
MAQNDGQERTEQATPKRLQEAREKGQTVRSREMNTLAMLLAAAGALLYLGAGLVNNMSALMRGGLHLTRTQVFDPAALTRVFGQGVFDALGALFPFFLLLVVVALGAPLLLGGWSFSSKALAFKMEKLDPIKGLGRLFSAHSGMELIKALVKFTLVVAALLVWLKYNAGAILNLGTEPLNAALAHTINLLAWAFLVCSSTMIVIAAADVPFQIWDHAKKLKMTRQEIRDEGKETDGNPQVKGRIRFLQREMAQRRMMAEVPKADVIITNPTHYAVALRYDQSRMRAPRLVAKGAGPIAQRIREVGAEHKVSIVSSPSLARAVYHSTDLNQEIPAGLYLSVAQVLAYVYQLRRRAEDPDLQPVPLPDDLPIPDEFRRD